MDAVGTSVKIVVANEKGESSPGTQTPETIDSPTKTPAAPQRRASIIGMCFINFYRAQ